MNATWMRWILMLLAAMALATAGCGSCDEESTGRHANNVQRPDAAHGCVDEDEDGVEAGPGCDAGEIDCDDSDASVYPGAEEVCDDGVDNNCDGEIDEDCACTDGESRDCGTDEGTCASGTQTCTDGVWSDCAGEVRPEPEVCDGVDNDCDGEVDEDPEESLCDDGIKCNGVEVCQQGQCVDSDPVDCSHLDQPCYEGICQEKDGSCAQQVIADGTSCDDGNFCTVGGTCNQGVCESDARDCSGAGDQCNEGVCDAQAEECVPRPISDGTSCDDGTFCTVGDACQAGTCEGSARDCSGAGDQCNDGVCDEQAGACVPQPVADDTACDDGLYCTVDDACQAGQCTGGSPRECSAAGGSCRTGTCDEQADSCTGDPVPDGTSCTNSQFCTVNDECLAGTCVAGDPRDCSAAGDQCNDGVCNEANSSCEPSPKADGTTCDDGQFCTASDVCTAGSCGGSTRDCSSAGDQCNDGVCDESNDQCVPQPLSDGTTCDDGQFCTVSDTCSAGSCGGSARSCAFAGDQCNDGVCDENAGSCVAQPVSDGTSCDDSQFCTVNDECTAGTCGGASRDCSSAGDQCNTGVCDEANATCAPQPVADGTSCDDSQFCTVSDTCTSGACTGSSRDCSAEGDQCNTGVCDESNNICFADPVADGTSCDDGVWCTVSDACSSGTCGGSPRNCSAESDQCNTGACDEANQTCYADPVADGTSCDDGQFCTVSDSCTAGSCGGSVRDCSAESDQCNTGACDENNDTCYPDPVADGTSCDDGLFCTVADACSSGTCDGSARDCSAESDQCNTGACDESSDTCYPDPVADGTSCDDGAYCTTNDTCTAGTCDGGSRDCSAYDAQCSVGMCDDSNDQCYSDPVADGTSCNDNDSCTANDACNSGTCSGVSNYPVADAGADQTVVPNSTVQLDGSGSYDPNGQALTYNWSFTSRPSGSSATISNATSQNASFLADVAGDYDVCLEVTNSDGCVSSTDCMQVTAVPTDDLHIELVWFSDDSDLDLHYRAPEGAWWNVCQGPGGNCSDCFYANDNPDWGKNGRYEKDNIALNDPILDVDNITGYGPENINQEEPFDNSTGNPYRVGVHYYSDKGAGNVSARLRIYLSGVLAFEETETLSCNEFWEVADIEVSNNGATVSITSLNGSSFQETRGQCP